jgi:Nitrous oxide-stimulated promoter
MAGGCPLIGSGTGEPLAKAADPQPVKIVYNVEMSASQDISTKEKSDIRTLIRFVAIYCREKHEGAKDPFLLKQLDIRRIEKKEILLCQDCKRLLTYGIGMRLACPHDPKPMCKKCESQCYKGAYKKKIKEIMKFSGMHLVKHGRVDMLYHYFR